MDVTREDELLLQKLKSFCEINEQFCIAFKHTEKNTNLNRRQKNDLHLHYIAQHIITLPTYFQSVVTHFSEFLPKIVSVAIGYDKGVKNIGHHKVNCVLLGRIIRVRNDLHWYATKYFESSPSPFVDEAHPVSKKSKMSQNIPISELDLVESCYALLRSNPQFYVKKWNWSEFTTKYLDHEIPEIQWIACHCVSVVTHMSENQLKDLILSKLSPETHEKFLCTYNNLLTLSKLESVSLGLDQHPVVSIGAKEIEEVVEISGVYIPKFKSSITPHQNLVMVNSTSNNLRKVAFGLSSKKAICLQGPVGSGKTSLVEYIADKTGRKLGENFIKVQLGDQTDSKMLLGTYRCTDIPGEFVWQPGVVTQAVIEGNWVLLEDIDSASMDIASVLSSLLENGSLTVPGYRDSLPITPGFQLFFTQRLMSTITGHHKKLSNAMTLLEKHLLQINIDPLTSAELKDILVSQHPQFATVADRMIKVFNLFTKNTDLPKTSRLISTRDFFKWCSRAAIDFDISSQNSALKVLQDAIDVFCCSFSKTEEALNLAREISTHLGIINQKAEFFFKSYKPVMKLTASNLEVGRGIIARDNDVLSLRQSYYFTRPATVLLERVLCCVNLQEPILLVGETGTGKTSTVQYLANAIGQKLVVINMNQQSDSADLLGGYKPVDLKFVISPIRKEFELVFSEYFQVEPNRTFIGHIARCYNEQRWSDLVKLMTKSYDAAISRLSQPSAPKQHLFPRWQSIGEKLHKLSLQLKQKSALAFAFIEGSLVKAVEEGHWVLLDEINLANAETLECLSGLLEGSRGSLCLLERGDKEPVRRHPNFTLFACMNPSTDVGKKDLPAGLRNRFTEFYVDELTEKNDLLLLVGSYLDALSLKEGELEKIVDFYLRVRKETEISLTDGLGHKPHFSLRSLCRALMITARNPCGMVKKSLYEAFCLSFLTQLDSQSYGIVENLIAKYLVGDDKALKSVLKQPIPTPKTNSDDYIQFEGYWVRKGNLECVVPDDYILTDSVRKNLKDLVRIVSIGGLPVLLQGDTSVGKTSLIAYLAKSSGNKCVRINNHEHTDLQEYIGSYVADCEGKLVFREGLLVEAMRKGHWIILDELNLAPSDVLEALNRVLDDNRELFIPETQETVKADPNFMLFATQNPPGSYGGRKMLSRAFRNRFVELHFNEIPPKELEFILHRRCQMAPSYAKKMINVMTDLQTRRRGSAAFAGKQGFITLRDLFRWGERYRLAQNTQKLYDWDQHLADEGYLVLAGRVRKSEEKNEIITVLQKHLKREVNPYNLFSLSEKTSIVTKSILTKIYENRDKYRNIVWTYNMRQLAVLVAKAFHFKEPVLLVGETGGGKTTVCKLIAELNQQELISVNCHMHTESSDFIGGLRPVRDHMDDDVNKLFEWVDGPLIKAMLKGNVFLADEISLADDSVLERLNSLLEPERTLLIAEKGADINNPNNSELIVADPNFYFIGTMNPGGDFGKKELSPALRNRFTEIWCESCTDRNDLVAIIEQNVKEGISFGNQQDGSSGIGKNVMDFVEWFRNTEIGKRCTVSIRDILTWVNFINNCAEKIGVYESYLHGLHLTFLDGLGSGITGTENLNSLKKFKRSCELYIKKQLSSSSLPDISSANLLIEESGNLFGIKPFYIETGNETRENHSFSFNAPTTTYNTLRLLRGMQLNKAILLEGSPGVGKTSLVTALAKLARHKIFRVNLSDQTDISDLFGADLPVEGGTGGQFSWRDGPLLQALKQGHWILLDELNLASQSVLEGLNACLDHRGEIFIPELGKTFYVKPGTRFFACQNPLKQGGSRRGLPQSFLNRFIQVYVTSLTDKDLNLILSNQFPGIPREIIDKMLKFNSRVHDELDSHSFGNKGSPWEFNLRDLTRWCEAMIYHFEVNPSVDKKYQPESLVHLIYGDRMRTLRDKRKVSEMFKEVFGRGISGDAPVLYINNEEVWIGDAGLRRNKDRIDVNVISEEKSCLVLRSQLPVLRSLAYCVNLNWMSLLVGSSAAGKSTVVRVLAHIVGKTLKTLPVTSAMDTTDILGGFEQTDYSRHLEEIVRETEQLLLKIVRTMLVKGRPCVELLRLWEGYSNVDGDVKIKHTMEEETKLFLRKLDELEKIWTVLCGTDECHDEQSLDKLRSKALKMRMCVKNQGSLNAGGKFEWVDSVLIKCLQEGSWLLVDNVNLCSAAVLDRLNALLEPNGVLTVGERGVDEKGRMVEIIPHPNFRLFLTMDPKNGEISRAMRNRGVEIYMLNEKENEYRNTLDIKSLISREGLKNINHIDSLLHLHDFTSDLILGEKPNVNELLRASALISQQIQHGTNQVDAFYNTMMEIYYKTRANMEFSCNDFDTVIKTEIGKVLALDKPTKQQFYDGVTLKTDKFHVGADLEKIKQQAASLHQMLEQNKFHGVINNLGKYLLIHFYSITSKHDLDLRFQYYTNLIDNNRRDLSDVSQIMYNFIKSFPTDFKDFPIDSRWIPETNYWGRSCFTSNKLILSLHFIANCKKEQLEFDKKEKKKSGQVSLRDYMTRRRQNTLDDQFDDVLIDEFLNLIESYDNFLLGILKDKIELSDDDVIKILELLTWRFIFHRCTVINVRKIDPNQRYLTLTNLKVHYRWFLKYSVNTVKLILNKQLSSELGDVLEKINKSLEKQFSLLHKFSKRFQKFSHKPPPKVSSLEIDLAACYGNALRKFDSLKHADLRSKIISLMLDNEMDLDRKINEIKMIEDSFENTEMSLNEYELDLLPVLDFLVKLQLKNNLLSSTSVEEQEFKSCLTLPIDLVASFLRYNRSKDVRICHNLFQSFFSYLSKCDLAGFCPVLTHNLSSLLVSTTNSAITKFGNFRELMKQHRQLSLILWRNLHQFHENAYDYCSNERKFICESFESFIGIISESLGVKSDSFIQLVDVCLKELDELNTDELSDSFLVHLRNCAKIYVGLNSCEEFHLSLLYVYDMHMELSYAKAILNSRLPLIDPSAKKALKKKYNVESVGNFEDLRDSFVKVNEVYSGNTKTLHSHYKPVVDMIKTLNIKNEQLGNYVAVRPKEVLYDEVVKVVNHGFSTILSCRYVDGIIQSLDSAVKDLIRGESSTDSERILKQYESSVSSYTNLINEWSKYGPSYPDVIEPLLSNVSEFLYGLKSNLELVKKLLLRHECRRFGFDMQEELGSLIGMPCLDRRHIRYESLIESYSKPQVLKFIDYALGSEEKTNLKKEKLRLLKCGIQETFNNCILDVNSTGILNFSHFENFIKAFVDAWNEQEKNREIAETEATALYKTRTKCDDKPETEQIEDELRELFPNYHDQDFADMRKVANLDDEIKSVEKKPSDVISDNDIKFVVDLHVSLVQNFTKTEWLNPEKDKTVVVNFLNPLIEKHKLFKQICGKVLPALDYRLDKDLVESMSVLLSFVQNYGDTNNLVEPASPVKILQAKRFDFYKDSNIEEVKSSFHILEELRLRTKTLLAEWPDHPTLKSIMTIIERVYSFDLTSPLSRFLTGFEILLSKCNEWEEVAHSGVSLSENAQNITHQIIAWRKMELNVWKDLLNSTFTRMNGPTYKWWLYLYNIMEQFEEKYTEIELIEALQNYVTKSNLAEFQTRLNLLHAFHCHAVHRKRTEKSHRFVSILWNVYNYFLQFAQIVSNKIKDLRAPIEKKLKDYVKIVRWKDVNYWAIKETVDKSHKTLHKYVREFQDVLNQPVSPYLVNTSNSSKIENVGIWDRPQRNVVKTYHYTLDATTYVAKESLKKKLSPKSSKYHQKLSNKIDSYFTEARKLCKDSISAMKYPKMIQTLDDLVTQIIETSTHLQNLEVDTTLDKDKQKSTAKSILNQKHRALADLFKVLSQMGLSFRAGLVEAKSKLAAEDFLLKPVDLSANFSHINYKRQDEKILTMWDNCEMYYLKSLMRADVLDTALKTPAQDLGQQNIARCRGFTSNLLFLAQKHKSQLTQSSNLFYYLRHYTNQITKMCDSKEFLTLETVSNIQITMKNIQIVLNQTKIFLNSCPEEDFTDSETRIVILKPEPEFIQYKNDQLWNKCNNLISETLNIANKICIDLEKSKGEVPHTDLQLFKLNFIPISDSSSIQNKLDNIKTNIGEVVRIFGKTKLSQSLSWIVGEVETLRLTIEDKLNGDFNIGNSLKQIEKLTDALCEKISQVVNILHKKYSDLSQEQEESRIEDEHLRVLIIENLDSDFKDLRIQEILDLCHEIARHFFTIPPSFLEEPKNLISCVLPLLEQISLYHQYFLTQQVSAYRVINKMNSVLLNIFIDLASRGFCVPPELTDDSEEGVSKPSDGLGLGEGQGEKDVSDKIESEDQLDDAQPAGQEKQKDEDPDCKEEDKGIDMSEDFDSKLQDIEPKDDEDEDKEDNESDADEQMGETEKDANRQDKETYGSDNEEENVESEDKEERGEGGEKDGDKELGAKENDKKSEDKPDKDSVNEKEEKKKEINEMEEPEYDDEQTDPYHGNQPELPEPEPMDLPDDLQLDEGQEPDENKDEENPFDIDAMKEDNPFEGKEKEEQDENENEDNPENEYSSDDEEITKNENEEDRRDQDPKEEDGIKEKVEEPEDEAEENSQVEESGFDQTQTNEDNVEAMDVDKSEATDKVTSNQTENQKSNQPIDELCQEDKPDKEGVGQSQMEESSTGHSAQTTNPQEMQSSKRQRDEDLKKQQKPGDSDAQRSLGDVNEPVKKKLKTIDSKDDNESEGEEAGDRDEEAEMYKHIKEAKESSTQVLDVATKEQAEDQKYDVPQTEEEKGEEPEESSENLRPEEEEKVENVDTSVQKPEKTESKKKKTDKKQHPKGDILDEVQDIEIEGEVVETMGVARGADTTYHTLYDELGNKTFSRLTQAEMNSLRHEVEKQLSAWTDVPSDIEADQAWQKISSVMSSLAQDLSEQLRLVLEPTQASRLKGDFRTGRRINMRKVIPYIASQFRKDKIWLRRTKPSKREYQIVLAIDDSSSMADNHSKELAFESVALISKALTLLESGQLSVVSFGENTEILHKLTDQFTDKSGVKLLQKFKFDQNKTCVGKLVDFVSEMFAQSQMHSSALIAKLLVIVSDGRGVFSEGESVVRQAVRRAKLANIFMVFVIIDNPENKNSILDIRMPTFKDGKLLGIQNYMDVFPFSFYIILRDINSLPNVLSDALRQWFEVVSNLDKQ
ncbi:midasin [Tribolium madens]|uniref:midasin n=1 Tax=Tribolium madens TaxID=41895 RepID=UPI001CF75A77|nr:midasin [Tribolium madens]